MKLLDTIKSQLDPVTKYIFELSDGLITEVAHINKGDGKESICVPCQTLCDQGCTFCHVTDYIGKIKNRNLKDYEMLQMINLVKGLNPKKAPILLVSFMGCGEPLANVTAIITVIKSLQDDVDRFAIATSIPDVLWPKFFKLCEYISLYDLNVKLHLSLHHTNDSYRKRLMPKALPIREAVSSLIWANKYLDTDCEVHYALIKGENDFKTNMLKLSDLFGGTNINIKFIRLTEKASSKLRGVEFEDIKDPIPFLTDVKYEFYSPPGKDVGASCGQFLLEHYKRYKK